MMTTAWNIAQGEGIKYNLNRPTTGIQPLYTFIMAALAKAVTACGGDKISFLRALIIFSSLIFILFAYTSAKIIVQLVPAVITKILPFYLALFSFDLFAYFTNGLETGFYLLIISLCIYFSLKFSQNPSYKSALFFGLLCGAAALTRIDFLLPAFIFFFLFLIKKKAFLKKVITAGAVLIIIVLPWIAYVYSVSGTILPSSVSAQSSFISVSNSGERFYGLISALMQHLSPFIYTTNFYAGLFFSFIFCVLYLHYSGKYNFAGVLDEKAIDNFLLWGISFLFLVPVYFLFSSASYFYNRYTLPLYLLIFEISSSFLIFLFSKYYLRYRKFFLAGFFMLFFIQGFYYNLVHESINPLSLRIDFIKKNFPDERIGLFQSGAAGFFNGNVLNLDGKMDHVVQYYNRNRNLGTFLDSMKINVLIEWREAFENLDGKYFMKKWKLYEDDIGDGRTACYIRIRK